MSELDNVRLCTKCAVEKSGEWLIILRNQNPTGQGRRQASPILRLHLLPMSKSLRNITSQIDLGQRKELWGWRE